jgi:hypothetical protein
MQIGKTIITMMAVATMTATVADSILMRMDL